MLILSLLLWLTLLGLAVIRWLDHKELVKQRLERLAQYAAHQLVVEELIQETASKLDGPRVGRIPALDL